MHIASLTLELLSDHVFFFSFTFFFNLSISSCDLYLVIVRSLKTINYVSLERSYGILPSYQVTGSSLLHFYSFKTNKKANVKVFQFYGQMMEGHHTLTFALYMSL